MYRAIGTEIARAKDMAMEGGLMKKLELPAPLLGFAVATRAALGAGIGLLASKKLRPSTRKRLGTALVAVGALTTIPILFLVRRQLSEPPAPLSSV
jgi:hypothetical protein